MNEKQSFLRRKNDEENDEELDEQQKQEKQEKITQKKEEMKKKFESFWKEYSRNIKYGLISDSSNKNLLAEVIKFHSTFNYTNTLVSFDDYISRMKTNQKDIYYLSGENIKAL